MAEAYVLAGELHRANGDYAQAFAAYEARLHAFVTAKQKAAVRFADSSRQSRRSRSKCATPPCTRSRSHSWQGYWSRTRSTTICSCRTISPPDVPQHRALADDLMAAMLSAITEG